MDHGTEHWTAEAAGVQWVYQGIIRSSEEGSGQSATPILSHHSEQMPPGKVVQVAHISDHGEIDDD